MLDLVFLFFFFFFKHFFLLKFLHTTYKTNTGTLFYNSLQFLTLNYDTNTNATLLTKKKQLHY